MAARDAFSLEVGPEGSIERVSDLVLRFRDAAGGAVPSWTATAVGIPIFWTAMFVCSDLTEMGAVTSQHLAVERLEHRKRAWKERASAAIFRGFERFATWVARQPARDVELDMSGAAAWRRPVFVAAARQAINYMDGASLDPGPLLSGHTEQVTWRRRKGICRLEGVGEFARWPDEDPLFIGRKWFLVHPTMGTPPFRNAPFPEWRIAANTLDPWPDEAVERAKDAEQAWKKIAHARATLDAAARGGNLDFIERARASWAEAAMAARALSETAAEFGARFRVTDDSPLWRALLEEVPRAEARLEKLRRDIEVAMRASGH